MKHDDAPWWSPGAETVAPGVHRIPLPMPSDGLRGINAYALESGDGLTLVDAGLAIPETREALVSALKTLGFELADIRRVLVTHVHHDHYTEAVHLRREVGAAVALGEAEQSSMRALLGPPEHREETHRLLVHLHGAPRLDGYSTDVFSASDWGLPDEWLTDHQIIGLGDRDLAVLHTPGHTTGHVVFRDSAAGLLFAGDHILPTITPSIGLQPVRAVNPLGDFLDSLARVRALPDTMLLPAHGVVTGSVHRRIDELVEHHAKRLGVMAAVVRLGGATVYEVAQQVTWTRRERSFTELDQRNQWLAVCETAAHLDLLAAQAQLTVTETGGVNSYHPV